MKPGRKRAGCLIIMAVCAGGFILYWLPGLLDSVQRGKQKRTVATMVQIRDALASHRRATGHYPEPADFAALLEREGPSPRVTDEWGRPFLYESGDDAYLLVSLGKDGVAEYDLNDTTGISRAPNMFAEDIVLRTGEFFHLQEGLAPQPR